MATGQPDSKHATDRWIWRGRRDDVHVAFAGRGTPASAKGLMAAIAPTEIDLAWAEQTHSATLLEARPGLCGVGDALTTDGRRLALCVVTADCVPLLLADGERIAAVHAGWRGIVAGVVHRAVAGFRDPTALTAWIGPAIGPCCYEVGPEVAEPIATATALDVLQSGPRARPHADLAAAVTTQLSRLGVASVERSTLCTRCCDELLWSFRRDGSGAGRNHALIWRD